jgi:anti-anti-sigma factor
MTQPKITITARQVANTISILDIQGELTAFAEEALVAAHKAASSDGAQTILLNFTEMESMNSAGASLLIIFLAQVQRQKQRLLAYGLAEPYQDAFALTQLDEAIGLYADEAEALKNVAG